MKNKLDERRDSKGRKLVGIWGDNHYVFNKEWERGRFSVKAEMRGNKCMGRFGGGWQWALGFEAGKTSIIFNLLVMMVRVSWYKPEQETETEK